MNCAATTKFDNVYRAIGLMYAVDIDGNASMAKTAMPA